MKIHLAVVVTILAILVSILIPRTASSDLQQKELNNQVRGFLESKESPLAPETDYLLQQEHWKLLIAISAIESQYCTKQIGLNCWGITKFEGGYRKYSSVKEGIKDANDLIERWQNKGRWLTVDDMNGHYVVPANENWVNVVNSVLKKLNELQSKTQ